MTRDQIIVELGNVVLDRKHRGDDKMMLAEVQSRWSGRDQQTATVLLYCMIFVKEEFGPSGVRDVQHRHERVELLT